MAEVVDIMVDQEAEKEAESVGWDDTFPWSTPNDCLPPYVLIATASQENTSSCVFKTGVCRRGFRFKPQQMPSLFSSSLLMSIIYP